MKFSKPLRNVNISHNRFTLYNSPLQIYFGGIDKASTFLYGHRPDFTISNRNNIGDAMRDEFGWHNI